MQPTWIAGAVQSGFVTFVSPFVVYLPDARETGT